MTSVPGRAAVKLIYGGTFDPVHHGHLAIARAVRERLDCPVALLPAADPPHRPPPGASAAARAQMLALAIQGEPGLSLDQRELHRDGPSYTVDTLRALRREQPLVLVLGADSFLSLPQWREWQALFTLAHLLIAERQHCDLAALPDALTQATATRWTQDAAHLRATPAGRILRLEQPLHPASATEVRRRLASGADWAALLPAAVAAHIRAQRLYGYN